MKLYRIETTGTPVTCKYSKTHWMLVYPYSVNFYTDVGVYKFRMEAGWITDYRSGSSWCDIIVPKVGNSKYCGTVLAHDMSYSGHLSKAEADELLYQGMILSGVSKWRAWLAFQAVSKFGGSAYYGITDHMPFPYEKNRDLEKFTWSDK